MMLTAYRVEMEKVFSKWRTYIGFIALGALIPIIVIALGIEGQDYLNIITQQFGSQFDFKGKLINGYTVSFIIFAALYVHVPFMITLVAGEVLAGEATSGTYRLILTRPISRATMVTAKYLAVLTYTVSLVFFMAIMSLGLGIPILGTDSLLVIRSETITILSADDLMWRFILAYIYAAMSMVTVASVAFLFSSLVENAIGPIMTTMSIIIGMTIISAIDVPIFDYLRPLFFTNHMNGWKFFFDVPADAESMKYAADWSRIAISGSVLMLHIVGCFVSAQLIIRRKDILT